MRHLLTTSVLVLLLALTALSLASCSGGEEPEQEEKIINLDALSTQMESNMNELERKWEKFKADADYQGDEAARKAQERFEEAKERLQAMGEAGEDDLAEAREDMKAAMRDLEEAMEEAARQ